MAMKTKLADNAKTLERELAWLSTLIETAIKLHFGVECEFSEVREIEPPSLADEPSPYAQTLREREVSFEERLVLALAFAPHVRPPLLDPFLMKNAELGRGYTEFGGAFSPAHGGFWPTLETAAFILAGGDLEKRFRLQLLLEPGHFFRSGQILQLEENSGLSGIFSTPLHLSREFLDRYTSGIRYQPAFGGNFPAKRISTAQEWSELVLNAQALDEVEEIKAWIEHRHTLLCDWQLDRKIKPGFRSLFYGPPGVGKTFTASLLGKSTGLDVYRVDLSLVVSKWVGETEKNLAGVFDQAQIHDWILFFDEADALFGKRTQTSSANDRYANQEVAYLLQRVEDFPGIVILASNLKGNIDEAFSRRFQSMIYFPLPGPEERFRLWSNAFSKRSKLESSVDLRAIAEEFEVAGGAIINVLRYASLMALRRGTDTISLQDIRQGIRREFRKDGKVI
ncbi:MAG: ATP-binding protein [Methylococcaceae bacterium]|nr:ATP-binding protein [Methylococcaceae bacterium]